MRHKSPNVVTVVQARTDSSRLPGKVLLPLMGKPVLARMLERLQAAKLAGAIVVATTTDRSDDPIEALCVAEDYPCFPRPSDGPARSPLPDGSMARSRRRRQDSIGLPADRPGSRRSSDQRLSAARAGQVDYVSNLHPATYPDGNDVEVMSFEALKTAWTEAVLGFEREHTTPFLWERPARFRLGNVAWKTGHDYSMTHRWTLDYRDDYVLISAIFEALYTTKRLFGIDDILALLARRPDLMYINSRYAGVNWYRHHLHELSSITAEQTRAVA